MAKKEENKKVKRATAIKRDLQSKRRRLSNKTYKARIRTAIRDFEESLTKDEVAAQEKLNAVYSLLDKSVKNGVYKLNKASRTKSRLAARAVAKV
jgi:small subunit ribosomal protein S20